MKYKMGIDLGGTKTEILVLDSDQHSVYRQRVATPSKCYEDILTVICEQVDAARSRLRADFSIGIGIPGAISPATGLLRNSNTVCMNGRRFVEDLESMLECRVRVENDANCFALSESFDGAAENYATVFGVIIGTGTGGGLVIDGKLINGPHSISGEWGHNPLPWSNPMDGTRDCYCGKKSCIETFLSGPGFSQSFYERFGKSLSGSEIVAGAVAGDRDCRQMIEVYHDQLARALAQLINILDPHAIVLGGGMSNIDSIYQRVPQLLPAYVFSDYVETPILKAAHGDSSGIFGAAFLWN